MPEQTAGNAPSREKIAGPGKETPREKAGQERKRFGKKQFPMPEYARQAAFSAAAGAGLTLFSALTGGVEHPWLFLILGILAGAAFLFLPYQEKKERRKRRQRRLTETYPELVTRLSLYMTAGLSLRSSWDRIVRDYRKELAAGGRRRTAYEEMDRTRREMLGGMYEDLAYSRFGRRCGTAEYLRLGGLLEAYVQQGNRELVRRLQAEAASSLELQLRSVRRRGEEVGSLLLVPIILLFALTLALVLIPALIGMQGALQ